MNKSERIECIINSLCDGNKSRFAKLIGVKPQTVNTWLTRDTFDIERVYSCCGALNPHWLLTGEGEMLKQSAAQEQSSVNTGDYSNVTLHSADEVHQTILVDSNRETETLRTLLAEKERTVQIQQQLIEALKKQSG